MQQGGYPIGAEFDSNAPYNQPTMKPIEMEVDVIVTLSKRVKIKVDDYVLEKDWDDDYGNILVPNFEDCDFYGHVKNQISLPQEKFKDWEVDDYQVLLN